MGEARPRVQAWRLFLVLVGLGCALGTGCGGASPTDPDLAVWQFSASFSSAGLSVSGSAGKATAAEVRVFVADEERTGKADVRVSLQVPPELRWPGGSAHVRWLETMYEYGEKEVVPVATSEPGGVTRLDLSIADVYVRWLTVDVRLEAAAPGSARVEARVFIGPAREDDTTVTIEVLP